MTNTTNTEIEMMTRNKLQPKPTIGQVITVEGVQYRVWDIPSYGVLILETMDGKNYFRLQGQGWKVE